MIQKLHRQRIEHKERFINLKPTTGNNSDADCGNKISKETAWYIHVLKVLLL